MENFEMFTFSWGSLFHTKTLFYTLLYGMVRGAFQRRRVHESTILAVWAAAIEKIWELMHWEVRGRRGQKTTRQSIDTRKGPFRRRARN
jgi:hypothetical protein